MSVNNKNIYRHALTPDLLKPTFDSMEFIILFLLLSAYGLTEAPERLTHTDLLRAARSGVTDPTDLLTQLTQFYALGPSYTLMDLHGNTVLIVTLGPGGSLVGITSADPRFNFPPARAKLEAVLFA